MAARALEFIILTAARSGETLGALWSEIDLDAALWNVPATRMKAGREHRVPLSPPAMALLRALDPLRGGKPLSNMSMDMVLRRMGSEVTVHGRVRN